MKRKPYEYPAGLAGWRAIVYGVFAFPVIAALNGWSHFVDWCDEVICP